MINGRGSRILPILAAVLASAALAVGITLLLIRTPSDKRFDESLTSAAFAYESGSESLMRRELLKASRHALSAGHWRSILSIAAAAIPENAEERNYRLFRTLAGRAAAAVPGDENITASWCWALLRNGDTDKALKHSEFLKSERWSTLRSEIRLKSSIGDSADDLEGFLAAAEAASDPEFLEMASGLTESAELAFDASLTYMLGGRPEKAFNLAQTIMDGDRRWSHSDTMTRKGVAYALAEIAQDAGRDALAIEWLEIRVAENRSRRTDTWESLQMLGDLYWERYLLIGDAGDRTRASSAWSEAIALVAETDDKGMWPEGTWRLWLNQAVLEESSGRIRASRELLEEALVLYPQSHEVKAAWALEMKDTEPALARRLAQSAFEETGDPVLGVTSLQLDPDSITPRLYEARLWSLFDEVTDPENGFHGTDGQTIVSFLLNYMASRRNYSSIDVAVDRYRRTNPDESWILAWRLASDAARRLAVINLVSPMPNTQSPYEEFLNESISKGSWRALHDSAMFALIAAEELSEAKSRFFSQGYDSGGTDDENLDGLVLSLLEDQAGKAYLSDTPVGDRISVLLRNRKDTEDFRKALSSSGRRGRDANASALSTIEEKRQSLFNDSLQALTVAGKAADNLTRTDLSTLKYLEAVVYSKMGRSPESIESARESLAADPGNVRARELLELEVSS